MKVVTFLFISFLFIYTSAFAIDARDSLSLPKDSVKAKIRPAKLTVYKFNYNFTSLDSVSMDTLSKGFQIYNPAFKNKAINTFTSNYLSPFISSVYCDRTKMSDYFFTQYISYNFHKPQDMAYYRARSPFTMLTYFSAGPKDHQEQSLNIIHTQNVNRKLNVGFLGDLRKSDGQFTNQQTKANSFSFFSGYKGTNYSAYGSMSLNKMSMDENGGISSDSAYEAKNSNTTTFGLKVNLPYAKSTINNKHLNVTQRLYLTGSFKSDSVFEASKWSEVVSVIHTLDLDINRRSYKDTKSAFYSRHYIPKTSKTDSTYVDSTYFRELDNTILVAVNAYQWLHIPAELRFGVRNELCKLGYSTLDSTVENGVAHYVRYKNISDGDNNAFVGHLFNRFSKTLRWGASLDYYFSGNKQNNLKLTGDIEKTIWGTFRLRAYAQIAKEKPVYFYNEFRSNNFRWNNTFDNQVVTTMKAELAQLKYKVSIEGQIDNYDNYVYFGADTVPVNSGTFSVSMLTLKKQIDWGFFHSDIRATIQASGDEGAISLPSFSGFNSTYLEFTLFKVLLTQIGGDVFYNTKYYANAYMPALGVFYAQKSVKVGDYPYVDAFVNFKLKRARFYVKYERINNLPYKLFPSDFDPVNGYFMPHYPFNPGFMKIGLSWTFYD